MIFIIYLFIVMAIALIGMGVGIIKPAKARFSPIGLTEDTRKAKKLRMHSYLAAIFPFTQKLLEKLKLDIKIRSKLEASHVTFSPQEFFNLKLILMLSLSILTIFIARKFDPALFLVSFALGYVVLDIWLNRKIKQRRQAIARLLPETVDLLGLCVEAGLDFTTAVKWVIDKVPANPMVKELAFVLEEIKWGKPRTQALRDMSRRLSIPEVSSFVQTLVQAERMGTPVAEAFAILSEDTRLQRFHKGERIAMQAPLKILIPLIFCILPVIGIVIGGPIFLQFMQGGMFKGF